MESKRYGKQMGVRACCGRTGKRATPRRPSNAVLSATFLLPCTSVLPDICPLDTFWWTINLIDDHGDCEALQIIYQCNKSLQNILQLSPHQSSGPFMKA